MKVINILTFALGILLLYSCSQGHIRRGDAAFKDMAYKKAVGHYEKALQNKKTTTIHAKIAKAYERMNNTVKAEEHYRLALMSDEAAPETKYHYAQTLLANGKTKESVEWMNKYLASSPNDKNATEWLSKNSKEGEYTEYDPSRIKVEIIPLSGYTATFGAVPNSDLVYFVGEKTPAKGDKINPWNGQSFLDVYQVKHVAGDEWIDPKPVPGALNGLLHDGPLSIDPSGQIAYVTRSAMDENNRRKLDATQTNQLRISEYSLSADGQWKFMRDLPCNDKNASSMHPTLCTDEKTLFFASDRAGGQGGTDLYVVNYDGQHWSEPVNLGSEINTPGNEVFPFASHKDTLFFSSNGHAGMGGLDVFISVFDGKKWSHPRNLKAPINTNFDDFSFFRKASGMSGYLSSNRNGKDEIYSWQVSDPTFLLVGKVIDIDKDPVPNTVVTLHEGDKIVDSVKTGKEGSFSMPLDWQKNYNVTGHHRLATTDTAHASTVGKTVSDTISVELRLGGPEFWVRGVVIDKNSKQRLPNIRVELLNAADARLNESNSDENGAFVFKLDRNQLYKLYGMRKNTFTRKVEVSTMNLKESKTFEVILELEEVKPATTIVLNNIYYDYNKWNIRTDAVGDLDNLLRFMLDNPAVKIEMRSHTDCRGTDAYNLDLSEKRAKSAMDYLISKGINAARMTHKGYGETVLVNECKDGVECSEEKHQENRRTEFKVLKLD